MKLSLRRFISGAAIAVTGAGSAFAADLPATNIAPPPPISDWIVTLSAQGSVGPLYPGANRYSLFGLPGVSIRRADQPERFSTPDDGFNIALYDNPWLHVGPTGRWIGDRARYGDRELTGMSYVAPSVEVGAFAEVTPLPWFRARLEVLEAVTGHDGMVGTASADVWHTFDKLTLSAGPRLYFGNNKFAETFFSVTPAQSAVNLASGGGLTPYNAGGGLTSAGLTVAARYDLNDRWRITGFGNYQRLTGSVADSPLTLHAGSPDQYTIGLEVAYRFRTSGWFNF